MMNASTVRVLFSYSLYTQCYNHVSSKVISYWTNGHKPRFLSTAMLRPHLQLKRTEWSQISDFTE